MPPCRSSASHCSNSCCISEPRGGNRFNNQCPGCTAFQRTCGFQIRHFIAQTDEGCAAVCKAARRLQCAATVLRWRELGAPAEKEIEATAPDAIVLPPPD